LPYDHPFRRFVSIALARTGELKHLYFLYKTCPKCAKKHGKNYVVLLARV
jgi:hypothetical protein